jgi:hypothetical protein
MSCSLVLFFSGGLWLAISAFSALRLLFVSHSHRVVFMAGIEGLRPRRQVQGLELELDELEVMARTDRRSLPCRSPFWRLWCWGFDGRR